MDYKELQCQFNATHELWGDSTIDGIELHIGADTVTLCDINVNAVLTASTGVYGVINSILLTATNQYSPEELSIELVGCNSDLDWEIYDAKFRYEVNKNDPKFKVLEEYSKTNISLPHVQAIEITATANDLLQYLETVQDVISHRMKLCREFGVYKVADLRKKFKDVTNKIGETLPRKLIVVDGYGGMHYWKQTEEVAKAFFECFKLGRAAGVHFLFVDTSIVACYRLSEFYRNCSVILCGNTTEAISQLITASNIGQKLGCAYGRIAVKDSESDFRIVETAPATDDYVTEQLLKYATMVNE